MSMRLGLPLVIISFVPGCDCYDTTDVVVSVEPAIECLHLETRSAGNECRMPHLRGTNSCAVPLTLTQYRN